MIPIDGKAHVYGSCRISMYQALWPRLFSILPVDLSLSRNPGFLVQFRTKYPQMATQHMGKVVILTVIIFG